MPQINVTDVLKELKNAGFYEAKNRTRGSHHRFEDGKGHKVTVKFTSRKGIIPPKTYQSIKNQAVLK